LANPQIEPKTIVQTGNPLRRSESGTEVLYLREYPERLFAVLHEPSRPADVGLVFCPPLWGETTSTYARLAVCAKQLAKQGIAVLRYDAYGTGESDGESEDFTLESALADAVTAATYLREVYGAKRVGLFGLRFGASVAVHSALASQPDFLLLWSPILNLRQCMRELLRLRLTKELVHQQYDHVRVTTQSMMSELDAGRPVDIVGYELSPSFYEQMVSHSSWPERQPAGEVLWLGRQREQAQGMPMVERWRSQGGQLEAQFLNEIAFWEENSPSLFPRLFMDVSYAWLASLMRRTESSK
jgi:exosortase A-associated hydrolase 2